jgi:multiple sugar transport system substrate-binding protein
MAFKKKAKRRVFYLMLAGVLLVVFSGYLVFAGREETEEMEGVSGQPYAGVTLHALMEDLTDTNVIEERLPDFEAKTGIKVVFEKVVYTTMHDKLVPQLMAGEGGGSYDFLEVDAYWVGEFVMANWLIPLDDYLKKTPEIKKDNYWESIVNMFTVGDKTWFIPMWAYPMGLLYRTDIVNDPDFQKFFEKESGQKWAFPPKDLYMYADMAKAAMKYTPEGVYGVSMQGAKIDPIVMEFTNYIYSLGGGYYDRHTWKASFNSKDGKDALKIFKDLHDNAAQPGASGANFDDAFNVFAQGKAVFAISYNFLMPMLLDQTNSEVYDKIGFAALPGGGGLNGAWSWAIPVSSPNPDAAWEYIKWVETPEMQKARGMGGGMPTAKWVYDDKEFLDKYKFQNGVKNILKVSKALPVITQSTRMVEIVGENTSSYVANEISMDEAVTNADRELNEIIEGDPLVEMQK